MSGGKLTAEQVREAIFSGSVYASYDGAQYYASGISMQAIADELNATLGGGECVFEINTDATAIRCNKCGYQLPVGTDLEGTRFCGGCGRRLKR